MTMLAIAAILATPSLVGLVALVSEGALGIVPAIAAGSLNAAAALGFAAWRAREHWEIGQEVRSAADGLVGKPGQRARLKGDIDRVVDLYARRSEALLQTLRTEESLIENLPDPLIVLGTERNVTRANAAARAAFGGEMAAVLRHPGLRNAIDRATATSASQEADLFLPVPVERELHVTVFHLAGGQFAAVLSDRTRERALERTRADFVANASHELRTPLASLIGFVDTLRGPAKDDPPAQARFLEIMADQGGRMSRLIDDLLSLSRIELTEHNAPTEAVDLNELLRFTAASFEPKVVRRGVQLALDLPEDLPLVAGDDDQLGQVFQNLMDNAIKYGREGGSVRVVAAPTAPGGRWPSRPGVTVAITDDGAGIAREHLPRLTERFYRVDKGRSRAVGGTGLGLAIVKHIVNRHRGQLAIDSQEGAGSTFTVWLPATS
ncbi:ATP-binding protein [Acidisphaera sp. L21]|uniref:ATP-binding protein n=1 Tax=Acidisphaera sp. L21 TaxID=1641851 RepID=UPI00131E516C|nr:ATP-binding protein [Acidisphaera sp. L21]